MDRALLTAPPSFAAGCRALSRLAAAAAPVARALACGDAAPDAPAVCAALPAAGEGDQARAAVDYIMRAVAAARPAPKPCKAALEAHTELTAPALEAVLEAIVKADLIKPAGSEVPPPPKPAVQLPAVEELAWTAGVAAHASVATGLQQPYVVLDFRLREGGAEAAAAAAAAGPAGGAAGGAAAGAAAAAAPAAPGAGGAGLFGALRSEKVEVTLGQLAAVETTLREALAALEKA
jgi:hypothetical protein